MSPERWAQIKEIFEQLLECEAEQRAIILQRMCGSDWELCSEVERLIQEHDSATASFLERQKQDAATELDSITRLGTTLDDRYAIESELGRGAFGIVYLARDLTLQSRPVVVKFLHTNTGTSLRREFEALAKVRHPGVAGLLDAGESGGGAYLVMEYVAGVTLRSRMRGQPFPLPGVVRLVTQIAAAIAAAHDHGVVHRDLKPENIMLERLKDGTEVVKVIDFGVARIEQSYNATAMTTKCFAGTLGYMAPEQLIGSTSGASDVYSLGVIAYELITGVHPLTTIAGGRTKISAPRDIRRRLPKAASNLVLKAISLRPQDRPKRPDVFARLLERSLAGHPWSRSLMLFAAALAVVIGAFYSKRQLDFTGGTKARAFGNASKAEVLLTPVTSYPGEERDPNVSPDGNRIAFSWKGDRGSSFNIFVKSIDSIAPLRLTTSLEDDTAPAWSPDGRRIAFIRNPGAGGEVRVISVNGDEEQLIGRSNGWSVAWTNDGQSLIVMNRDSEKDQYAGYVISLKSDSRKQITFPPSVGIGDYDFVSAPDGRIAFTRMTHLAVAEVLVIPAAGREAQQIAKTDGLIKGLAWTPNGGEIVFSLERAGTPRLWKVRAIPGATPEPVAGVDANARRPAIPRFREKTDRIVYERFEQPQNVFVQPLGSSVGPTPLFPSTRHTAAPQFSPDGRQIVFASDRTGHWLMWVSDRDGQQLRSLVEGGSPRWSPDGSRIAFDQVSGGRRNVYTMDIAGGPPVAAAPGRGDQSLPSWSADGRYILFTSDWSGRHELWKVAGRGGAPIQITRNGGFEGFESSDGTQLFYTKSRERAGLWVLNLQNGEERLLHSDVTYAHWAVGDQGIYFLDGRNRVHLINEGTGTTTVLRDSIAMEKGRITFFSVARSGRAALYVVEEPANSDLMMAAGKLFN